MAQRKALGKGLDALIPSDARQAAAERANLCPIEDIHPSSRQPRKSMDKAQIEELSQSIKSSGLLQPLLVRPRKKGAPGYELIAGERRWRAAKLAGLESVPVLLRDVDDREALVLSLVENLQRQDLNAIEEADAYQLLLTDFDLTQEDVSKRVGKSRPTIANVLRLLKLPEEIKKKLRKGELTEGHARAILSAGTPERMKELAELIVKRDLTVREAEDLARERAGVKKGKAGPGRAADRKHDPFIRDLEAMLKRHLGTKVKIIHTKGKGGRIEIYYYSNQDLERIIGLVRK